MFNISIYQPKPYQQSNHHITTGIRNATGLTDQLDWVLWLEELSTVWSEPTIHTIMVDFNHLVATILRLEVKIKRGDCLPRTDGDLPRKGEGHPWKDKAWPGRNGGHSGDDHSNRGLNQRLCHCQTARATIMKDQRSRRDSKRAHKAITE